MTHLAWNCRGSGEYLRSSTRLHLARLLNSIKPHVCFLSKTITTCITKNAIKNHFNYKDAFVVPSQGQSGGLWLIWNDGIDLTIVDHNHHFIFALCTNKISMRHLRHLWGPSSQYHLKHLGERSTFCDSKQQLTYVLYGRS
jgi:hypothetical protein